MAIVRLLEDYRNKKTKNNFDNLVENKLSDNIDKDFQKELFMENFLIGKVLNKDKSQNSIKQRIENLKRIEKKYFTVSNKLEDKITLLSYFARLSDEYYLKLIDYTDNTLEEIINESKLNWIIAIFEGLTTDEEKIVSYIKYLQELRSGEIQLDYGRTTPSYRDIQSSISIGSEYNFQKA